MILLTAEVALVSERRIGREKLQRSDKYVFIIKFSVCGVQVSPAKMHTRVRVCTVFST
jgi:hypothetical protein